MVRRPSCGGIYLQRLLEERHLARVIRSVRLSRLRKAAVKLERHRASRLGAGPWIAHRGERSLEYSAIRIATAQDLPDRPLTSRTRGYPCVRRPQAPLSSWTFGFAGARANRVEDDRFAHECLLVSGRHDAVAAVGEGGVVSYDYDRKVNAPLPGDVRRRLGELESTGSDRESRHDRLQPQASKGPVANDIPAEWSGCDPRNRGGRRDPRVDGG